MDVLSARLMMWDFYCLMNTDWGIFCLATESPHPKVSKAATAVGGAPSQNPRLSAAALTVKFQMKRLLRTTGSKNSLLQTHTKSFHLMFFFFFN